MTAAAGKVAAQKMTGSSSAAEQPASKPAGRLKSAGEGAAGGAAAGPEGAAAGAALGLLTGGGGKRKSLAPGRKALMGEWLMCMTLMLVRPFAGGADTAAGPWLQKSLAICAVYALLSFISATGEMPRRVANGVGLLVMLAVVITDQAVLPGVLSKLGGTGGGADGGGGDDG